MRAMVLAAGLGTRLRPLTTELPKPAVSVANVPLAVIALRHLARAGVTDVVVNAHHLPDVLAASLETFPVAGLHVEVVREPVLLGTGGGVRAALAAQAARLGPIGAQESVFLMNGDVLFLPDLGRALARHEALGATATMVLRADARADVLGPIDVDRAGRVRRILRAPGEPDPSWDTCMFTGVHVLSGRAVALLPSEGCIIRNGYARWLESEIVAGSIESAPFRDCGTPSDLLLAMDDVLKGVVTLPGVEVAAGCVVDVAARVDGAKLLGSCVGSRAFVAPGVSIERCLVLPGAQVRSDARDAIISPLHRLAG